MSSLDTDSYRVLLLSLLVVTTLLGAWLAWLFLARVARYVESEQGHLVGTATIVADFSPAALGRIQPGQPARLRLESFPWIKYGAVRATVATVAREPSDGWLEVKLSIQPDPSTAVPLQHGQTGAVEVEVERVAPAALVLRAAGQLLATPEAQSEQE